MNGFGGPLIKWGRALLQALGQAFGLIWFDLVGFALSGFDSGRRRGSHAIFPLRVISRKGPERAEGGECQENRLARRRGDAEEWWMRENDIGTRVETRRSSE